MNKLTKHHEQELSETLDALDKQSALARFQAAQGAQDAQDAEVRDEFYAEDWDELEVDEIAWEEELRAIEENYDDISPENS